MPLSEQILIDASNGASDYGNKFGEPLLAGYTRSFGLRLFNGERREWIKPIMFRSALPCSRQGCSITAMPPDVWTSANEAAFTNVWPVCPCSGGLGQIDHQHLEKKEPQIGMLIVKIGGPAYRIGMGGGAASSVASGSNKAELDFNAVQVSLLHFTACVTILASCLDRRCAVAAGAASMRVCVCRGVMRRCPRSCGAW